MIDANLRRMLEELRESYVKIMLIFNEVTQMSIQDRLTKIDNARKAIGEIEQKVRQQDKALKDMHESVI